MTSVTDRTRLEGSALADLEASMRGQVVLPDDPTYDEHRKVWNGSIDKHPAVVARCAGAADVRAAIRFGREHGLDLAVRGGGHSFPGLSTCDGGLVIDLSLMRGIRVDPVARRATAQAGVLLGELDRETQAFGLAAPTGIVTHTGLAGLTLGGGIGWIMRRHGLTVDRLVSADLITADGDFVKASEDENADLFWGLRGGGGNFGVVTQFELDLAPLGPQVMAGPVFWLMEDAREVLRFYRDWIADCPDDLMTIVVTRRAPALPVVPPELVGRHVVIVVACYAGSVEDGERVIAPLKSFGSPVLDLCMPKPYLVHQSMFDPSFKHGWHYYVRSCDVDVLDDDVIDVVVDNASRIVSPISSIALWQLGGAVARVGEDDTAFNGRNAGHSFNINGNSESGDGFDVERDWVRKFWSDLAPWHTSVYVNFLMEEGEARVREAYGDVKYDRLKTLKRTYDPNNVFHLNQNIKP
jgi:hypothetical protein